MQENRTLHYFYFNAFSQNLKMRPLFFSTYKLYSTAHDTSALEATSPPYHYLGELNCLIEFFTYSTIVLKLRFTTFTKFCISSVFFILKAQTNRVIPHQNIMQSALSTLSTLSGFCFGEGLLYWFVIICQSFSLCSYLKRFSKSAQNRILH